VFQLFINNKFVPSVSGKTFETLNPATGKPICSVAEADAADVDIAVKAARDCFENVWKRTDARERGRLLYKLGDLIEKHAAELAALESFDNGKPISEAVNADLQLVLQCYRYYAGWADKVEGRVLPVNGGGLAYTKSEPVGVVGQIIPSVTCSSQQRC